MPAIKAAVQFELRTRRMNSAGIEICLAQGEPAKRREDIRVHSPMDHRGFLLACPGIVPGQDD
jgi:hypothetical protein